MRILQAFVLASLMGAMLNSCSSLKNPSLQETFFAPERFQIKKGTPIQLEGKTYKLGTDVEVVTLDHHTERTTILLMELLSK